MRIAPTRPAQAHHRSMTHAVRGTAADLPSPRAALLRLLDAGHPWGSIEHSTTRYGAASEWLTVLPPDTTPEDRRWVAVARAMPAVALLAVLIVGGTAAAAGAPWPVAFGLPAAVLAAAWIVVAHRAAPVLRRAVHVGARTSALVASPEGEAAVRRVRRIAHRLCAVEREVRAGTAPAARLRLEWQDAYELVGTLEHLDHESRAGR